MMGYVITGYAYKGIGTAEIKNNRRIIFYNYVSNRLVISYFHCLILIH